VCEFVGCALSCVLVTLIAFSGVAGALPATHPKRLAHAQLVRRGSAICATSQQRLYQLQNDILKGDVYPSSFPDDRFTRFYRESVKLGRQTIAFLRKLTPSRKDEAAYRAGLAGLEGYVGVIKSLGDAERSGDEERYQALAGAPIPRAVTSRLAQLQALGINPCANLGLGPGSGG
jgi:hypothetical protein